MQPSIVSRVRGTLKDILMELTGSELELCSATGALDKLKVDASDEGGVFMIVRPSDVVMETAANACGTAIIVRATKSHASNSLKDAWHNEWIALFIDIPRRILDLYILQKFNVTRKKIAVVSKIILRQRIQRVVAYI
jgi:hypothetical protein